MPDFLLELGTEEIPAGYIKPILKSSEEFLQGFLAANRLSSQAVTTYATPRRLVFYVQGLPLKQADVDKEILGPAATIAFDQHNNPTVALYGFVKKNNVQLSDIKIKDTSKGKVCYINITIKGQETEKILPYIVQSLITSFQWPKSMRWQTTRQRFAQGGQIVLAPDGVRIEKSFTLLFARPLRYIMALLGNKAITDLLKDIPSGNKTYGHPFLSPKTIIITSADLTKYKAALKKAKVLVDQNERRQVIERPLNKHNINEPELLEEVTNLVEWPVILECGFDESYLKLPAAVIESAMKSHQRYFPVKDKDGKLLNKFIVVANMPATKEIKEGNERVIKARLSDALFFWEQDRKTPLSEYAKRLDTIAFLGKLGTMAEKSKRLETLATYIAQVCNYQNIAETIKQSARLCKADLLTGMVGEFPDLQGIMGYEYLKDTEPDVAIAIREHYQPRFAGDALPQTPSGICLSLAEKFDNIVAAFALGLEPTGSNDPYGLRRQTRTIIDIIFNQTIKSLSISKMIDDTIVTLWPKLPVPNSGQYAPIEPRTKEMAQLIMRILSFIKDRLSQIYIDNGYPIEFINAVMVVNKELPDRWWEPSARPIDSIINLDNRIKAVLKLSQHPIWDELIEVVERTYNIGKSVQVDGEVTETLLKEKEEIELYQAYKDNKGKIQELITKEQYEEASRLYHKVFARPAHIFFEKVFVNVPEQDIRQNRILLNKKINQLYSSQIADLSRIQRNTTGNKATSPA